MDKQAIKEICLRHGYKLKPQADGSLDLDAYVYDAFDDVLSRVRHGQRKRNLDRSTTLTDALYLIQRGTRFDDEDLEHGLELLRRTRDELCAVPRYLDDVELVGMKHAEYNFTGVPDLPRKDIMPPVPYYPLGELDDDNLKETKTSPQPNDPINPNHYKTQSGVECIEVASLFPYSLGNAIKYAWRAGRKDNLKQDLEKCEWYLNRAIVNYEIVFLKPHTEAARKARLKLEKVLGELPERNAEILSNIIQGDLQGALSLLDDWITELD